MNPGDIALVLRDGLMVALKLAGPPMLVGLAVGLVVSLLQAITQLNEAALAFIPKALALALTLALAGPFMFATLSDYTHQIFDRIIAIGGS
jgi:flagellar biosynthetic protein FliQ